MQNMGNSLKIQTWTDRITRNSNSLSPDNSNLNYPYDQIDSNGNFYDLNRPQRIPKSDNSDNYTITRAVDVVSSQSEGIQQVANEEQSGTFDIDINEVANRVYKIMQKELVRDKERLGK